MSAPSCTRRRIPFAASLILGLLARPLCAQGEASVEALAGVLAAEDARRYDGPALTRGAHDADASVRRHAALAIGRIGSRAGLRTLLELIADPDSAVAADAAFALGLLNEPEALPRLRELMFNTPADQQTSLHAEAATAVAKIGGPEGARILTELLDRWAARARDATFPVSVVQALSEAWRLKGQVPARAILPFVESPLYEAQWRALYSLGRLRAPEAAQVLLQATSDRDCFVREIAVRALTASYADTSRIDRDAVATRVRRLAGDDSAAVRIAALRSLATFANPAYAQTAIERLNDRESGVRSQAIATLGRLGGAAAEAALRQQLASGPVALRRQALVSLASGAKAGALPAVLAWAADTAWLTRYTAVDALVASRSDSAVPALARLVRDADARVAHAALSGVMRLDSLHATPLAREMIAHADPIVRTVAADWLGAHPDTADIARLAAAYQRALLDKLSSARIAAATALGKIAALGFGARVDVEDRFLARVPPAQDYLVRRAVADGFPAAAQRWGPETPVATGRSIGDYRDLARNVVLPADHSQPLPGLVIETDRGSITLALFAADAPITVRSLLYLVDRRVFDGGAWHRVVPGFVIQDGDPRGDGEGGPDYSLRDEINRQRYLTGVVGMALSGPDTGGSQFFITLDPQPHLDGTYTVIGRVLSGMDVVTQVAQGDRIRRIRKP
jgi:cyclophilin family peptidyl-prolyl cis-trans isomerase/HEAT repeat protein